MVPAMTLAQGFSHDGPMKWTSNGAPTPTAITGGPWTLEQSGAANGLRSSGYCDGLGNQIGNPGTEPGQLARVGTRVNRRLRSGPRI